MLALSSEQTLQGLAEKTAEVTYTVTGSLISSGTGAYGILAQGQLESSVHELYKVPSEDSALISHIILCNTSSEALGVALFANGTTAAHQTTQLLIPAHGMATFDRDGWKVHDSSGRIQDGVVGPEGPKGEKGEKGLEGKEGKEGGGGGGGGGGLIASNFVEAEEGPTAEEGKTPELMPTPDEVTINVPAGGSLVRIYFALIAKDAGAGYCKWWLYIDGVQAENTLGQPVAGKNGQSSRYRFAIRANEQFAPEAEGPSEPGPSDAIGHPLNVWLPEGEHKIDVRFTAGSLANDKAKERRLVVVCP